MIIEIAHGEPKSPYFLIAQPKREYRESRTDPKLTVNLVDPNTKSTTRAQLQMWYSYPMKDFKSANGVCLLAYGMYAAEIEFRLKEIYPELNNPEAIIEFWILKRVN